ncbi:hypothetical protein ACER0C_002103 [Sarotherodon galilaeus]
MICRILLLIILTSLNVTQTSYQAEENHNITLEWTFTTKPDPKYIFINCDQKSSGKVHEIFSNKIQYHIRDVVEVSVSQDERFLGRVQSDKDALREGRIKLQLSRLRTEDSSMYTCHVKTDYGSGSASSELEVTTIVENPQTPQPSLIPPQESKDRSGRVGLGMGISSSVLVVCAALCFILRNNKKRKNLMLNVSETQLICTNMKPSRGQTFYQELVELQINT